MSHTVTCKVEMKNEEALRNAIDFLQLPTINNGLIGTHQLYGGNTARGIGIKLPEWKHPVVVDLETGNAKYDNFEGRWGKQLELDRLVQRYSIERTRLESAVLGFNAAEEVLENGDVKLVMTQIAST